MSEKPEIDKVALRIEEWLEWHWDEGFIPEDIFKHYDWRDPATKKIVYNRLYYLTKTQQPPTLKKRGKLYWVIDREVEIIRWKNADRNSFFDIKLPFDLHQYIRLHKRSVMIVGGVSNEGKTTFIHNVIALNIQSHKMLLFDSENSDEELAGRLSYYPNYESWPEDFIMDRSQNFSDCIDPDAINLIDYLEIQDNFWLVGRYIREIRDVLRNGIAIIVLQKAEHAKLPVGKEFARHLPRCVITIDKGILTIIKAKDRAIKTTNPVNMKWSFRIDDTGTKFLDVKRVYTQSEFGDEQIY